MIVVKVELWPEGDAKQAQPLGILAIENIGQVPGDQADHYRIELQPARRGPIKGAYAQVRHWKQTGWLRLVTRAFEAVDR